MHLDAALKSLLDSFGSGIFGETFLQRLVRPVARQRLRSCCCGSQIIVQRTTGKRAIKPGCHSDIKAGKNKTVTQTTASTLTKASPLNYLNIAPSISGSDEWNRYVHVLYAQIDAVWNWNSAADTSSLSRTTCTTVHNGFSYSKFGRLSWHKEDQVAQLQLSSSYLMRSVGSPMMKSHEMKSTLKM